VLKNNNVSTQYRYKNNSPWKKRHHCHFDTKTHLWRKNSAENPHNNWRQNSSVCKIYNCVKTYVHWWHFRWIVCMILRQTVLFELVRVLSVPLEVPAHWVHYLPNPQNSRLILPPLVVRSPTPPWGKTAAFFTLFWSKNFWLVFRFLFGKIRLFWHLQIFFV